MKKILLASCMVFVSGAFASNISQLSRIVDEKRVTLASDFLSRYTPIYNEEMK